MLNIKFSSMLCGALALSRQAGLASATPVSMRALSDQPSPEAPKALIADSDDRYRTFQPSMDFDTDGCYNWPAIDKEGKVSQGTSVNGISFGCRSPKDLDNSNVYARRRCNRGWCAYMYAYYFAKDSAMFGIGSHKHDWEHVIVWTKSDIAAGGAYKNERVAYVAASRHGGYTVRPAKDVRMDGKTHPKIVYHQEFGRSHAFRFAKAADDKVENDKGAWFRGGLVGWGGFPAGVRQKLLEANFGHAHLALKDDDFTKHLIKTMNMDEMKDGPKKGEFDCAYDEQPATGSS